MWIQLFTVFIATHLCFAQNVTDPAREARIDAMIAQVDPKVELHLHFEGTVQHSTAYQLLKEKNLPILGDGSERSFIEAIKALPFVETYNIFLSAIRGDLDAIERVAYELCEMQAEQGVIYSELHYPPHFLLPKKTNDYKSNRITVRDVVQAVNRGLDLGQRRFKVYVRSVLTIVRVLSPELASEIVDLAISFRNEGVVGIDMGAFLGVDGITDERVMDETLNFQPEIVAAYKFARDNGVKRTTHAGFFGPPEIVIKAIEVLKVNRISHGYRILEDEKLYRKMIELGIHFEGSPSTAETVATGQNNPIVRYAKDGASFSASSDFPTATKTTLTEEYRLLARAGVSVRQMQLSNIKAMKNAFADTDLKRKILDILYESYGLDPYEEATSDYERRKHPIIISRPIQSTKVQTVETLKKEITVPKYQPKVLDKKVITTNTGLNAKELEEEEELVEAPKYSKPQIIAEEKNTYKTGNLPDTYCDCSSIPFQPILPSPPVVTKPQPPQYSTLPRYAQPKQYYVPIPHSNTHHQRQPPITHVQPYYQRHYTPLKPIVQQQQHYHLPSPYKYRLA